ncbi:hypothetical protein [Dendrosporobacter sp. 1207_IL3150]|uniref:hypothetical protein n=1 Tax=Dendrosporobacter sp. 1207_IL3150 TaxID=3084054 RepID=UPI002FDA1E3B
MSNGSSDKTMLQSIIRMLDTTEGNYDSLINLLSLLCIITILNKNQSHTVNSAVPTTTAGSPIQKLLGELTKGDGGGGGGGPSMDTLMSLLPLLNSPQLKSKLNPSNMSSILGLINTLGGSGGSHSSNNSNEKNDTSKPEKQEKIDTKPEVKSETKKESPAAAITEAMPIPPNSTINETEEESKRSTGRFLNWKTSF